MFRKILAIKLLILVSFGQLFSQINITTTSAPTQLIQSLFGSGVQVGEAQLICGNGGIASFSNGTSYIQLSEGVLLTTGRASFVKGLASSLMNVDLSTLGDADLNQLILSTGQTETTEDACVYTVSFIAQTQLMDFNFVFGSEEYDEYVGQGYSDVFGIWVTGPKPNGGQYVKQNLAVIPGTQTPLTINTINNGPEPPFGGTPTGPCKNCQYYIYNGNSTQIKFDGLTKKLNYRLPLVLGQTYTLKLAVADAGDGLHDSGVFVERINFVPSPFVTHSTTACPGDSIHLSVNPVFNYDHFVWSTGDSSSSLHFAPDSSGYVYLNSYTDSVNFVRDSIYITYLPQVPSVSINVASDTVCSGSLANLHAVGSQTDFLWSTGDTLPLIKPLIYHDSIITLTGSFGGNCVSVDSIYIHSFINQANPYVTISQDTLCIGQDFMVTGFNADSYLISYDSSSISTPYYATFNSVLGQNVVTIISSYINGCPSDTLFAPLVVEECTGVRDVVANIADMEVLVKTTGVWVKSLKAGTVTMYSSDGKQVFNKQINNNDELFLNKESFSKGVYFIQLNNTTKKILID